MHGGRPPGRATRSVPSSFLSCARSSLHSGRSVTQEPAAWPRAAGFVLKGRVAAGNLLCRRVGGRSRWRWRRPGAGCRSRSGRGSRPRCGSGRWSRRRTGARARPRWHRLAHRAGTAIGPATPAIGAEVEARRARTAALVAAPLTAPPAAAVRAAMPVRAAPAIDQDKGIRAADWCDGERCFCRHRHAERQPGGKPENGLQIHIDLPMQVMSRSMVRADHFPRPRA